MLSSNPAYIKCLGDFKDWTEKYGPFSPQDAFKLGWEWCEEEAQKLLEERVRDERDEAAQEAVEEWRYDLTDNITTACEGEDYDLDEQTLVMVRWLFATMRLPDTALQAILARVKRRDL